MDDMTSINPTDIAIVGMALRVPGARTVDEFWHNLSHSVESIRDVTDEELLAAGVSQDKLHDTRYVKRTSDMPDMEMFDADFFGMSPKDAAIMDPQHRHFLECTWEALENAGRIPGPASGPVGVFAGCGMGSYFYFNVCSHKALVDQVGMFLLRHTGNDKDFLATRASFLFDLRGPSVNVQTACSTSLVAVHYACQSLINAECDMAIAGGVTIELPHRRGYTFHEGEILSPDGRCRPFDHRAAGTVFGSGAGVVVLRRLADAIADGDHIHAVIKATAINNDGASKAGYLAPSVNGQAEAIIEAQGLAGITADTIQYVECHGTGTYLGDPIEIEALTQAFRQSTSRTGFCHVGSVKSNIGHLDTAAGVVSLIKATLALKNGLIPATLGFEKPNPSIDFAASAFKVASAPTPWPAVDGPRRAAVNSLGVGGTNAHAIIEEAPRQAEAAGRPDDPDANHLFVLTAKSKKALDQASQRLAAALRKDPATTLADAAYTLHAGRKHFEHRRVVAVRGRQDAIDTLEATGSRRHFTHSVLAGQPRAVFLLPGGGSQAPGMAADLYRDQPVFRDAVDEGLSYLPADVSALIRELCCRPKAQMTVDPDLFVRPSLQLPAILIVEVALARYWMSHGISPAALIGHSMGENAAACISGVFSFRDAVGLVHLRGELFDTIKGGGMLSVPLPEAELRERLPAELDLASVNAPGLCVVSGTRDALARFRDELAAQGIDAQNVAIDIAAHSRWLDPILGRFESYLRSIVLSAPRIPIVSNLTGTWLRDDEAQDPAYWVRHLRSTVQFAKGFAELTGDGETVFIEVGPGRTLSSLAKAQGTIDSNCVVNTLAHGDEPVDGAVHALAALGRAWSLGLAVDLATVFDPQARRVPLPAYAFQHQKYFLDRVAAKAQSDEVEGVLGKIQDRAAWGYRPVWKPSVVDVAADDGRAAVRPEKWLVFLDDTGVGTALVERLRAAGHAVTTVELGDAFLQVSPEAYRLCPEFGREGYDSLVRALVAGGGLPDRIVHLWLLTRDRAHRAGSSFFHRNQEQGFYSLLFLAQALSGEGASAPLDLTVVTNGAMAVGDEPLVYPEKATVLGPVQVIPREFPDLTVRLVDLAAAPAETATTRRRVGRLRPAADEARETVPELLWDEIRGRDASGVYALRGHRRWRRDIDLQPLEETAAAAPWRTRGTYLITGGAGDIGLSIAEELGRRFQARVVLVSRTALPRRETWQAFIANPANDPRLARAVEALIRIEEAGGVVLPLAGDVTNPDDMAAVVARATEEFGEINGVIHAAGVIRDDLIALKQVSDVEDVLAPKVYGTEILHQLFDTRPLDVFVLFSSTSTDTAPAGQIDYVAANAYLNAYARSQANRPDGRRTVAIHWGVWNAVGMAVRSLETAGGLQVDEERTPLHGNFAEKVTDGRGRIQFETDLSPARDWILDEHRLSTGESVLPGTGYISLLTEAVRALDLNGPFAIEDLGFLQPLFVRDGSEQRVVVELNAESGSFRAFVQSLSRSAGSVARLTHAEAKVSFGGPAASTAIDIKAIAQRCGLGRTATGGGAIRSAQEAQLRFGPHWQVLQSLAIGQREALAFLRTPAHASGARWKVDAGLLDIATGFAMDLIPGYRPEQGLWVPVSYGRLAVAQDMPAAIWSWARLVEVSASSGFATFDVTIADPDGTVVATVERFTIKRLDGAFKPAPAGAAGATGGRRDVELSPALQRLAAQIAQGIRPEEGRDVFFRAVATGLPEVIVSSVDVQALRRQAAAHRVEEGPSGAFDRPDLDSEYVAPGTDTERKVAGFWEELLGVSKVGVNDDFFDLGGHSLIAVRLFRMIKKEFSVDLPMSVLFDAKTVAQCAAIIDDMKPSSSGQPAAAAAEKPAATRYTHLVLMDKGRDPAARPIFVCAGMFGNILNLRHLALRLGQDRPVYGLQARGLYGDQAPHETFEEMAASYLAEIRTVQPHGPYVFAGFSGGGLVAYEMAQQLEAVGESVSTVIMLDTPRPEKVELSLIDKVVIKLQDIQAQKGDFVANWIRNQREWRRNLKLMREAGQVERSDEFHNVSIAMAFNRALDRYVVKPYAGRVLLLRPETEVAYRLPDGRELHGSRSIVRADNGWGPYVANLHVTAVRGTHDTMVLEPHVRGLVVQIRAEIARTAEVREPSLMAAE